MAKRAALPVEESDTGSLSQRFLRELRKDKDLAAEFALGSEELDSDIPYFISTQSALLNYIIGQPGIPGGHLTVLIGKEGGGKSSLLTHLEAECQAMGGIVAHADGERRFSRDRAERMGLRVEDVIFLQALNLDDLFNQIELVVEQAPKLAPGLPVLIGVDSLAAYAAKAKWEGTSDRIASVAAIVSDRLTVLMPKLARNGVTLVIINQLRMHIDTSNRGPRSRERRKVMGERAMRAEGSLVYWGDLILYLTSTGILGEKDNPEGISARAEIRKTSIARGEGLWCEMDFYAWDGLDRLGSKLDLLERLGYIEQAGGWYKLKDSDEKGFRRADFGAWLDAHPEFEDVIKEAPRLWLKG